MRRTIGRFVRPAIATMLVAATTVAVGAPTAHAATATFTKVPTRLYMIPKEHSAVVPDLLAGLVIDENKPDYGRGDYLMRGVLGADEATGAIAVGELVRVGQTLRFHARDAGSADEDLQLTLAETLAVAPGRPAGALLFSCNGRGRTMFDGPDHDSQALAAASGPWPNSTTWARSDSRAARTGPGGPSPIARSIRARASSYRRCALRSRARFTYARYWSGFRAMARSRLSAASASRPCSNRKAPRWTSRA